MLIRDQRGAAAVEFAIIAPVMITMYLGLAELVQGLIAGQKMTHAAAVVGDLVTQNSQISQAQLDDNFTIVKAILAPYPTNTLAMRVTAVQVGTDLVPRVTWSKVNGTGYTAYATNATISGLPAVYKVSGQMTIMSEVKYSYSSPLAKVLPNGVNMKRTWYLRPRNAGGTVTFN